MIVEDATANGFVCARGYSSLTGLPQNLKNSLFSGVMLLLGAISGDDRVNAETANIACVLASNSPKEKNSSFIAA